MRLYCAGPKSPIEPSRATIPGQAEVAELADAPDSKSGSLRGVWVRFPPSASAVERWRGRAETTGPQPKNTAPPGSVGSIPTFGTALSAGAPYAALRYAHGSASPGNGD